MGEMSPGVINGAESRRVRAGGLDTHCYVMGSGTPLILLHGGGAGADSYGNWRGCLPEFARGHQVYAVDMAGFGFTDQPDPAGYEYSQPARVDHIIALLEALKLRQVAIIGNSMVQGVRYHAPWGDLVISRQRTVTDRWASLAVLLQRIRERVGLRRLLNRSQGNQIDTERHRALRLSLPMNG